MSKEEKDKGYWENLDKQFQGMQTNIEIELAKMQQALASKNKDMTDNLDNLAKINGMFHSNMDKQLDFQSRLDKILEESNKRQLDMQLKFQEMISRVNTAQHPKVVQKKAEPVKEQPLTTYDIKID